MTEPTRTSRATPPRSPEERRARRVAESQHQARRTLAMAALFVVAAPLAALMPHRTGSWLGLHLLLVGGLLGAISGATQLLAVTWSGAPAPLRRLASAQRLAVGGGAVAVATGRELDLSALTAAGAVLVLGALVLLATILVGVRRASTTDRFNPAIDAYLVAIVWGLAGVAIGGMIAIADTVWWVRLRDAHLTINLFGLVGIVIAGTLPYFIATQARTRMSARAAPGASRALLGLLSVSVGVAVAGHLIQRPGVVAGGLVGYGAGTLALGGLMPTIGRRQISWAGPRLVQLGTGLVWWAIGAILLAVSELSTAVEERSALWGLVVGGYAQILVGSLAYFGPVLRGGGHRRLTAGFATTGSWVSVAAGNLAAIGLVAGWEWLAATSIAVWVIDGAARAIRLVSDRGAAAT